MCGTGDRAGLGERLERRWSAYLVGRSEQARTEPVLRDKKYKKYKVSLKIYLQLVTPSDACRWRRLPIRPLFLHALRLSQHCALQMCSLRSASAAPPTLISPAVVVCGTEGASWKSEQLHLYIPPKCFVRKPLDSWPPT